MINAAASAATCAGVRAPRGRKATATASTTANASTASLIGARVG